ncbi:MAG: hypothetical protein WBL82_17510, partial [Terriglobales bacterium]
KCGASGKVGPDPIPKGSCGKDNSRSREERHRKIGHDNGQVRGDRRVDSEEKKSTERNTCVKNAFQRKSQSEQQKAVQPVHCRSGAPLDRIGIVLPEDGKIRKRPFFRLVIELAKRIQSKSCCMHDNARPKFHKRRVLGIDSEIVVLHVRDASGDVVGLIDGEAIQAG